MSLLKQIEAHLKSSGLPATRFGRIVVNDPRLVHDLRNGRQPGPGIVARVTRFIAADRRA